MYDALEEGRWRLTTSYPWLERLGSVPPWRLTPADVDKRPHLHLTACPTIRRRLCARETRVTECRGKVVSRRL